MKPHALRQVARFVKTRPVTASFGPAFGRCLQILGHHLQIKSLFPHPDVIVIKNHCHEGVPGDEGGKNNFQQTHER